MSRCIYVNFRPVSGPYGGANSFLGGLCAGLRKLGYEITHCVHEQFDLALLNSALPDIDAERVKAIADRGIPIIHRKTGFAVSGGRDLNRSVDGVPWGDRLQIEFSKHVALSIFQSRYSLRTFMTEGFKGLFVVIHNGVDESLFHPYVRTGLFRTRRETRSQWRGESPIRVVISSWSPNYNKGYHDLAEIDLLLRGRSDVCVSFVGRTPANLKFQQIADLGPKRRARLADMLRSHHVYLQLSRQETCSNALIEGIACGLPVIYLDSGANAEIAASYGVEFHSDFFGALNEVRRGYTGFFEATLTHPYRLSAAVGRYAKAIDNVLSGEPSGELSSSI